MRKLLAVTLTPFLVFLAVGCNEQPFDPGIAAAEGGEPGPPPGKGPPPGTPIPPGAGPPFLSSYAVGAGGSFSCALQSSLAYCWGSNGLGQLGDGTTTGSPNPVAVAGDRRYSALAVGDAHACALESDGTAWCWGWNLRGELGAGLPAGFSEFSSVPVQVAGGHSFTAIAAGLRLTCGITDAGAAYCWGLNSVGQLGDGTNTNSNVPVAVNTGLAFQSITVDLRKACGLTADGTAYCWGDDRSIGKLGLGSPLAVATTVPTPVVGGLTFESLAIDVNNDNSILGHTCGITTSGDAYCWGSNSTGQLGGASSEVCEFNSQQFDCSSSPVLVQGGITFTEVAVGLASGAGTFPEHTCGLAETGEVYCWGGNGSGELGDGTFTDSSTPVLVNLP